MKVANSPNGQYSVNFIDAGEIRFGPPYFELEIYGRTLSGRFFGDFAVWSSNSQYLAVQEWLAKDAAASPNTILTVFNMIERKERQIGRAQNGWVIPIAFENSKIVYRKHQNDGLTKEYEVDLSQVDDWTSIS